MCYFDWTYPKSILALAITLPCLLFAQHNSEKGHADRDERSVSLSQEEEGAVSVTNLSNLSFGTFYPGKMGGSIEISKEGVRTASGSVILLHSESNASAAIFEIKCPSNTMIHILIDNSIELRDESGMILICEPILTEPTHFVSPNNAEAGFLYSIGAKLNVPDASFDTVVRYSGSIHVFLVLE